MMAYVMQANVNNVACLFRLRALCLGISSEPGRVLRTLPYGLQSLPLQHRQSDHNVSVAGRIRGCRVLHIKACNGMNSTYALLSMTSTDYMILKDLHFPTH